MSDPLTITTSVIAFLEAVEKIYEKAKDFKEAAKTIDELALFTTSIRRTLQSLEEHFDGDHDSSIYIHGFQDLFERNPAYGKSPVERKWVKGKLLQSLDRQLIPMEKTLRPLVHSSQSPSIVNSSKEADVDTSDDEAHIRFSLSSFKGNIRKRFSQAGSSKLLRQSRWPFQKKETKETIEQLLKLRNEVDRLVPYIIMGMKDKKQKQSEFHEVLEWLDPTNFGEMHRSHSDTFSARPVPSGWLLDDPAFLAWKKGQAWHLALYGVPGSGKTILASQIIDHLRETQKDDRNKAVVFAYLKNENRNSQSTGAVLSLLLKQMVARSGFQNLTAEIREAWQQAKTDGQARPKHDKALDFFRSQITLRKDTYVVLDGLDEASDDTRHELLDVIRKLSKELSTSETRLHFVFTSRRVGKQERVHDGLCQGVNEQTCCPENSKSTYYAGVLTGKQGRFLCQPCALSDDHARAKHRAIDSIDIDIHIHEDSIRRYIESLLSAEVAGGIMDHPPSLAEIEQLSDLDTDGEQEAESAQSAFARVLRRNKRLAPIIVDSIVESSSNIYLMAFMQWEHVRDSETRRDVEEALASVPREINDGYEKTMERLLIRETDTRKSGRRRRILMWISQSFGRLTLTSLQHAMAISSSDIEAGETHRPITLGDADDINKTTLLVGTRGLVTMREGGELHLFHKTAYEFFEQQDVRDKWFPNCTVQMANSFLITLSNPALNSPCEDARDPGQGDTESDLVKQRAKSFPFAVFASQYWGTYVKPCQDLPKVLLLLKAFLFNAGNLASAVQMGAYQEELHQVGGWDVRKGVNALHVAAWFGLDSTFEHLLEDHRLRVDGPDETSNRWTPLIHATRAGHGNAVTRLLALGANAEYRDAKGWTAIIHSTSAVDAKHCKSAVEALCNHRNININATVPGSGTTALINAAYKGYHLIVQTLIQHPRIEVNLQESNGGFTALALAARYGSSETVDSLLGCEHAVNIDLCTNNNLTPLLLAAMSGHLEIVKSLLQRQANPAIQDPLGGTALRRAVDFGHLAVVQEFERHSLLIDTKDFNGKGILFSAAVNDFAELAQLLINHGFPVNDRANNGRSPLHDAASSGRKRTVQLLLDRGADPSLEDALGKTAADLAREDQADYALEQLLKPGQAIAPEARSDRALPATTLARKGFSDLLRERATQTGSDILRANSNGETALAIAIHERHFDSARIILGAYVTQNQTICTVSKIQRTPLHEAVDTNDTSITKELLALEPYSGFDIKDRGGSTPLSLATAHHNAEMVIILLESGAEIDPSYLPPGHTLKVAVEAGKVDIVTKLVSKGARPSNELLQLALEKKDMQIYKVLRRNWTQLRPPPDEVEALKRKETSIGVSFEETEESPELPSAPRTPLPDFSKLESDVRPFKAREAALTS